MISLGAAAQMEVPAGLWPAELGSWKPLSVLVAPPESVNQFIITLLHSTHICQSVHHNINTHNVSTLFQPHDDTNEVPLLMLVTKMVTGH